ncbi:DUF3576 domain-containing protein [Mesobacterium pallidum]|uniref:DUF3576 domain-containing protein n=1 Tax=Mesobacterium pallidum TaxID=2872037 RepID=UPI001EE3606B|nr:DUF3576 domain-containing protein [Mesobacterium pallidum]
MSTARSLTAALCVALALAGCSRGNGGGTAAPAGAPAGEFVPASESNFFDLINPPRTEDVGQVNRYIWNASLDVLSFLPLQTVDPFTGTIVTGYGTPPGGGRAYRATVLITDPALEARSLKVALATRNGPVSTATQRAVEDSILARARQMRISDSRF